MDFDHILSTPLVMLAQEGGPPPGPGEPIQGADGAPPAGGGAGGGGQQNAPPAMGGQFLWLIIILFGGMILFSILAQRRDRKKREAMLGAVTKHDRVQTIGGMIGSVVEVKENTIVLKVDESTNTRITLARSAVQQILSADSDTAGASGLRSELEESAR